MKIIFFGTPKFAAYILEALHNEEDITVDMVVTQPDRPVGRKKLLTPPIVKTLAEELEIDYFQPENSEELYQKLSTKNVDFFIVVAYGKILSSEVLQLPKLDSVNVHASLLPKYRGASPIQSSLLNGDKETGISIMSMDSEMDQGPVYLTKRVNIEDNDNLDTLSEKLSILASQLLPHTLRDIMHSALTPIPQNESEASYCRKIEKKDGSIDWKSKPEDILNLIRAFYGWPTAYTTFNNKKLHIHEAELDTKSSKLQPGTFFLEDNTLKVSTDAQNILPKKLQISGKNIMSSRYFINGYRSLLSSS